LFLRQELWCISGDERLLALVLHQLQLGGNAA
jgi:hypothetical protein